MTTILKVNDIITLELVNDKHASSIFELVNANRTLLREWLPWVDNMQHVDFISTFINGSLQRNKDEAEFAFVILVNQTVAGRIGIYKIDHQNKIAEIGYWLGEKFQGKGVVINSCKTLINYCFNELGINRIEIKCGTENYKSQRIPEQLNFKKEGIIRKGEFLFNKNKFIDLAIYSFLKEEWGKINSDMNYCLTEKNTD